MRVAGAGERVAIAERLDARFRPAQHVGGLRTLDLGAVAGRGGGAQVAAEGVDGLRDDDRSEQRDEGIGGPRDRVGFGLRVRIGFILGTGGIDRPTEVEKLVDARRGLIARASSVANASSAR